MNPENDVEDFAKSLILLGVQEQEIVKSFEKRMSTWYAHRKYALEILNDVKAKAPIADLINRIRKEILPAFDIDYVVKEEEALRKESEKLSVGDSILRNEFAEAQQTMAKGKLGEATKQKISNYLERTEEILKEELREKTLIEHLRSAVRNLRVIIQQELAITDEEKRTLDRLEAEQGNEKLAQELVSIVSSLQLKLYEEKNKVIDPLNVILKQKLDVATRVNALVKKRAITGKITVDDIKRDLRLLTKPDEVMEYSLLVQQHPRLTEDRCKTLLSKWGVRSLARQKTSLFEHAWEAITDSLTGIFNKGFFKKKIHESVREAQETGTEISLMMFDLDLFKPINDQYGHQVGDDALTEVVNIINAHKKRKDILSRYGGEEFALISFETFNNAVMTAERIRLLVEELSRKFVQAKGITDRESLTASAGVAVFRGTSSSVSDKVIDDAVTKLVKLADIALFEAKEAGRNRVVSSGLAVMVKGDKAMVTPLRKL